MKYHAKPTQIACGWFVVVYSYKMYSGQILKKLSQSPTRLLLQPFPHHQVSLMGKMNFGEVAFDTQKFADIIVGNLAKTRVKVQELALHGKKPWCAYRHYNIPSVFQTAD